MEGVLGHDHRQQIAQRVQHSKFSIIQQLITCFTCYKVLHHPSVYSLVLFYLGLAPSPLDELGPSSLGAEYGVMLLVGLIAL